ncbi:MAG: hypothetical protein ACOYVG_04465 [Bacteroidota bacterium]
MATLKSLTEFEGTIGNITAYKRRDSDKTYLRTKGGASKKKIKKHKAFERTRELNAEWSGCAKAAALVRDLLYKQQSVVDYNLSGPLTAIAKNIQTRDVVHKKGERSVLFSSYGHVLEGFQLNRKSSFESIIRGNVQVQLIREEAKAIVQLPELIPGISFLAPVALPVFNIALSFGTLPDLHFVDGGYSIHHENPQHIQLCTAYQTAWYYSADTVAAQTVELVLNNPLQMIPQDALALAISVNFGNPVTNELVKSVRYVGAGKLLKVVNANQ